MSIISKTFSIYDKFVSNHAEEILDILKGRYQDQLGNNPKPEMERQLAMVKLFNESNTPPEILAAFSKDGLKSLIITYDEESEKIIAVSGYETVPEYYGFPPNFNKGRMFAMSKDSTDFSSMKAYRAMKEVLSSHLRELKNIGDTYFEITYSLSKNLARMAKDTTIYYYPAESAVKITGTRGVKVTEDGVTYYKFVKEAKVWGRKIVIATVPEIKGEKGYTTFEEASNAAKYKDKSIGYRYGSIQELPFSQQAFDAYPISTASNKNVIKIAKLYYKFSKSI